MAINSIAIINFANNYNVSTNTVSTHTKSLPEVFTRGPPRLPQHQRLQQQKYFKINAQKIVDLNPLVKYIKTLDSAMHLEPIPLFSVDYNHQKSRDSIFKHQSPAVKKRPVLTTPAPSVFYSYRYNSDAYTPRKATTTPMPFNITQYRKATTPTSTMISSFLKLSTATDRQTTTTTTTTRKPSIDITLMKLGSTSQVPSRPMSLFPTPDPFVTATKCVDKACRLPDCFCGGTNSPGIIRSSKAHLAYC